MSSFLNKVFGYKKHDERDDTLLDGKYEAIAPVLSPTVATFAESQHTKDSDRDVFAIFRPRARGASQKQRQSENVPHLTLQLPGPKENRSLGVVFEADPDAQSTLDDAVIAAKRLSPSEALVLVRACTHAIVERGLETLGVMHPHWFSASPDVQRRLISLFIRSLSQIRSTTLPSTPTPPTPAFENELRYTRLPHDVAAVLRWGLRHLSLENGRFGKDGPEWGWYDTFFQAERNASYPLRGFSELLLPQLPPSHAELLTTALTLISSLASHAEANSISGSKLSKFLGLWLLVATRAEATEDWNTFYARWERSGRVLEHLFLARLREESAVQRLPTRLQELVKSYPYSKGSPAVDDGLLSRPRFSTRQCDALFVRVESLLMPGAVRPKQHPIRLLLEAFQLPIDDDPSANEHVALWRALKTTASEEASSSDAEGPQFTRIFVDETIHLLSLIPTGNSPLMSPTLLTSPIATAVSRKASSRTTTSERAVSKSNADHGSTPVSPPLSPTSPVVITDWTQFTRSGFGETPTTQPLAALLSQDDDIEVTQPRISRKSSRHRGKSRSRRRGSEDNDPLDAPLSSHPDPGSFVVGTKLASVHVAQIDEAFIDFWSDAIVDPISANWPTFVICGLKQIPSAEQPIRWLVIEQAYARQEPQSGRVPSPDGRRGRSPRPSFKSDISGFRINSVFSTARKRFSLFSKSVTDLDPKKAGGKTPVTGELGEILVEEGPPAPPAEVGLHLDRNVAVRATVIGGATAGDRSDANRVSTTPPAPPLKEGSEPVQAAVEAPAIELVPQSASNDTFVMPVRTSEETISDKRDLPGVVDPKASAIAPLTADTPPSRSVQDTYDPLESVVSAESSVTEEAEIVLQDIAVEAEDQPVKPVAEGSDLHAEAIGASDVVQVDDSRENPEVVSIPSALETVALPSGTPPAAAAEAPEPAVEEPLQQSSVDPVAAFTVESVGRQEIDVLEPPSSHEVIATETGARVGPISAVDEEAQDVAGHAEIRTPAQELVLMVEETPGQDASVDVCGRAGHPATQPKVSDARAALQPVDAAPQTVAAELQATQEARAPCVEVVDANVAAESEPAAAQVPEPSAEEAQPHVQDDVSAGIGIAPTQAEGAAPAGVEAPARSVHEDDDDLHVGVQDGEAPWSLPELAPSVDETPGPVIPADAHEPVDTDPAASPEFDVVEAKTQEPSAEAVVGAKPSPTLLGEAEPSSGAELSAQVRDERVAVEALSTTASSLEATTTAALATRDEVVIAAQEDVPTQPVASIIAPQQVQEEDEAHDAPEPVAEQVLVDAATSIASEPVAIVPIAPHELHEDAQQALIDTDARSTVPVPLSADDDVVPEFAPEEIGLQQDAPLEADVAPAVDDVLGEEAAEPAVHGVPGGRTPAETVVSGASEPETRAVEPEAAEVVVVEAEDAAPAVVVEASSDQVGASHAEIDETVQVDRQEPQTADDLAGPVTSESSVSMPAPTGQSEETAPAAP